MADICIARKAFLIYVKAFWKSRAFCDIFVILYFNSPQNMKKVLFLSLMFVILLTFSACGSKNENELDNIENIDLEDSNIENVDIDTNISSDSENEIDQNEKDDDTAKSRKITEIPDWAKKLGLSKAEGMTIDLEQSIESDSEIEGFNSFTLVYSGDYDTAVQEAERIADEANLNISSELENVVNEANEMMAMPNFEDLPKEMRTDLEDVNNTAIYSNFSVNTFDLNNDSDEYNISVAVQADGQLSISAFDYKAMLNSGYISKNANEEFDIGFQL